jgi:uncharacterized Ntn-hydrolase superfamily protein
MARPSTYSIVACDLERGEWGVAVQSKFLAVGSVVSWAEAGVGAIATQAYANPRYGPDGLALLREGGRARAVVEKLTGEDEGAVDRQVGIVDAYGESSTYTGNDCFEWAGGRTGLGYAAQGNILVSEATVDALAETFESTEGPLAERLIACLAAAQAAGGDRRGQQSAALYVVRAGGGYDGCGVLVDLRVDDHTAPIAELERLYGLQQLYFGETPEEDWITVDASLDGELRRRLAGLGYETGDLARDLETWAGVENLEERVDGVARIDPVVLEELRRR